MVMSRLDFSSHSSEQVWKQCITCGRYKLKSSPCKHHATTNHATINHATTDHTTTDHTTPFILNSTLCLPLHFITDSAYKRKYIESTDNPHKQSPLLPHPHPTNVLLLNPLTMLVAGLRMPQMVTLQVVKVGDTQAPSYQVGEKGCLSNTYTVMPDHSLPPHHLATHDTTLKPSHTKFCFLSPWSPPSPCPLASLCFLQLVEGDGDLDDQSWTEKVVKTYKDGAYLFEGQEFSLGGRGERVKVVSLKSRDGCGGGGYHLISPTTKFTVVESDASPINNQTDIHTDNHKVSMATGGGKLLEWLCRGVGRRGGRNVIRSCLLQGSPGSGKRALVRGTADRCGMLLMEVSAKELYSVHLDDFRNNLQSLSRRVMMTSHSAKDQAILLFLPSLPSLLPSHPSSVNYPCILNHFLATMLNEQDNLLIVATTTTSSPLLPPFLTASRGGVFSLCLSLPHPSESDKLQLLRGLTGVADTGDICLRGYSLQDMRHVVLKATMASMLEGTSIGLKHLRDVINNTPPSLMKGVVVEKEGVTYKDIGGRQDLKDLLKRSIHLSIHHPHLLAPTNLSPPSGILLFGPPGCSKTMLAKAVALECSLNFVAVQGTSLHRMYVGETEAAVRNIFHTARNSPSLLFFDEVDAFASKRGSDSTAGVQERLMQQLLTEMDACNKLNSVFTVAATNRPDLIDKAFLRPGRFDRCVYVPLPDERTRKEILCKRLNEVVGVERGEEKGGVEGEGVGMATVVDDDTMATMVEETKGFSCAEVSSVVDEACLLALEEDPQATRLRPSHLFAVIRHTRPSVTPDMVTWYEEYNQKFAH